MTDAAAATDVDEHDAVFAALAHPTRRAILTLLNRPRSELTSGAIAERFDCAWPTTTRHLRQLEAAGLVVVEMRGRERVYRLSRARLRDVAARWLEKFV